MKGKTLNSSSSLPEMCAKERASREVDRQSEDSFPASDPPFFSGGSFIGAPRGRHESGPAPAIKAAILEKASEAERGSISRHDAEKAIHAELGKRKLTDPMTPAEMLAFTIEMFGKLDFPTKGDRLQEIQTWVERWQDLWLTDQTSN